MKTFKAKLIALMLVVSLALTGCMQADVGVKINSDGSGSVSSVVTVDKQAVIDEMAKISEEAGEPLDKEAYAKELDASMVEEGYKLVTIDGKEYYQVSSKENIKKGNLQKHFADENAASYVTTDTVYLEIPVDNSSEDMQTIQMMSAMYGVDLSSDVIKYTVTVEMPKAIVSTNGKVDASNKNKASFNISLDKSSTIFVTTKSGVTTKSVKATIKKLNTVKKPTIKSLKANKVKKKAKKASITLKFKKVKGIKKYEVQWSTKKNFKNASKKTIKKNTYTIKKLKKGKKYYVRVRATKTNYAGLKIYSKWAKKSVKTKK